MLSFVVCLFNYLKKLATNIPKICAFSPTLLKKPEQEIGNSPLADAAVDQAVIFVEKMSRKAWIRCAIWLLFMAGNFSLRAQYFYQDLYSTWQTNAKQQQYRKWRVKKIQIYSYDANHERDNSFSVEKRFEADYHDVYSVTHSVVNGDSWLTSTFDSAYRIVQSVDSSNFAVNSTRYQYDSAGRLTRIDILSRTPSTAIGETMLTETHLFRYDASGHPLQMWKIKNQTDTSIVRFVVDSAGRVTQEKDSLDGRVLSFYFSYTADGLLSGILRYDSAAQKAVPTLLWTYDDAGMIRRMMVIAGGNGGSNVWEYAYDARGLLQTERCLADGKTFIGSVEYTYEFY